MVARAKKASLPSASASAQAAWGKDVPNKLIDAAAKYDFPSTPEWSDLDQLSSNTQFEGLSVSPEGAVFDNGTFIAPGTVHVRLIYGKKDDLVEFSDSYPVRLFFRVLDVESGEVKIDRIEADTSSFYR
jgi:hypothetical protein